MKKNTEHVSYIIMGITGDLSYKKVIPSLWHLYSNNHLPQKYTVIGIARRELSLDTYREFVYNSIQTHTKERIDKDLFENFFSNFSYISGNFDDIKTFNTLNQKIKFLEDNFCTNKVFYLATPPNFFESIFKNISAIGLNKSCNLDSWVRVLIEKPFGIDLKTSNTLQALLTQYFKEDQIYRIDHYLFKEIIQGIENFRFSNNLFENTWDNTTIEKIEIKLFEELGVENRGNFYDAVGTLRDVGQNHLLTMLSAIISESPIGENYSVFQKNREDALRLLPELSFEDIKNNTKRAQHQGYLTIKNVKEYSKTETYFSIQTKLTGNKWGGVSVLMEAGKRMGETRKEIIITLKHPKICLLCDGGDHQPNKIIFRFDPNDEIKINFYSKKPGFKDGIEERDFTFFLYEKETKIQYVEEYSKVFFNVVEGNKSKFLSDKEVELSWKFIDPILKVWADDYVSLETYPINKFFGSVKDLNTKQKGNISIIGLGKMGSNITKRLLKYGWNVFGYNRSSEITNTLTQFGMNPLYSIEDLIKETSSPRLVWIMISHQATDEVLNSLIPILQEGDTIIDGGNSNYKDSIRRKKLLQNKKINFLDVGVSGGPEGALNGACLMIGGDKSIYEKYEQVFTDLSIIGGYKYLGESGAGHFAKMVRNGIEYGMMQSIGEGFEVIKKSSLNLDLKEVSDIYNHGSVIESKLINWLHRAYCKFGQELDEKECCSGIISHSGEGQWTVDVAKELHVPVKIIEESLEFRKKSKDNPTYTGKVVSALRHEFGGHNTSH